MTLGLISKIRSHIQLAKADGLICSHDKTSHLKILKSIITQVIVIIDIL